MLGQEVRRNLGTGYNLYSIYIVQDIKVSSINGYFKILHHLELWIFDLLCAFLITLDSHAVVSPALPW